MVKITIDVPEVVMNQIEHFMIDNKKDCKNKGGNLDKRIAIIRILEDYPFKEE